MASVRRAPPPNASRVRASRPSSPSISSLVATRSAIGWRLARRSASMPWTFWGSEIATQSESPSNAYGMAVTCCRTRRGTDSAAIGSMPALLSSTTGSPCCAATSRAIAALEASPSSISTCTTGRCFAFSRTASTFASGMSPAVSRRSTTSSPISCEIGAGVAGPFGPGPSPGLRAGWADTAVASRQKVRR